MDPMTRYWRVGRHLGRTIYAMVDHENPSDDDVFIGIMESEELAFHVVALHNQNKCLE
jgi:hypothetical protein